MGDSCDCQANCRSVRKVNAHVFLAIAGCFGSGKTTLAEELARELEGTHFHLYLTIATLPTSATKSAPEKL